MAEEKKDPPKLLSNAQNPADWITAYYGDDAADFSKKNKIRHIIRVCEFADVVAVVTKNAKQAHTDFFESKYTAVDSSYVKAAELIVRLLEVKYRECRPLTIDDFKACGGEAMFGGRPDFEKICEDYIGEGGLVGNCEITCFPTPKTDKKNNDDLHRDNESYKDYYAWLKNASEDEIEARVLEKKRLMFGSMVEDIDDVKSHHTQILSIASEGERADGALNAQSLISMCNATTDKASNMYRDFKDKRSKIDFTIRDDLDRAAELRYETAKKTIKVGALAGVATASMGAVIGGVFWPALLLIPAYSLAKSWVPDWAKALGAQWTHFEKSMGNRFKRQKYDSYLHYMVSFMENAGKPKLRLKDRLFLKKDVIKTLKKGAKSGSVGASFERESDGKTTVSEIDRFKQNLQTKGYKEKDKIVAVDKKFELKGKVEAIAPDKATFDEFIKLANRYEEYQADLDSDTKLEFQIAYSNKLKDSAKKLIFNTEMESMSRFHDIVSKALADDGKIMTTMKDVDGHDSAGVEKIKRLREFASKELAELNAVDWKGKTFDEFIRRPATPKMELAELVHEYNDSNGVTRNLDMSDGHVASAIAYIENLKVNPKDFREVVSQAGDNDPIFTLDSIQQEIARIADNNDKERVNNLLWSQVDLVFKDASRKDTVEAYESVLNDEFTGRHAFSKIFDEIKDMSFEDIDSEKYSSLVEDLEKKSRISPMAMGRYLRGKISKKAQDVFGYYLKAPKNQTKFKTDLTFLIEYLSKLNSSVLLNQQQKAALTQEATKSVNLAFEQFVKNLSDDFMGTYDPKVIGKYADNEYAAGGLKTLFDTDGSANVLTIRNELSGLRRYNSIHKNLKFNGYTISATDQTIIGKVLLTDSNTSFNSVKERSGTDLLVTFLTNKLTMSNVYNNFNGRGVDAAGQYDALDLKAFIQGSNTPYSELKEKLEHIQTQMAGVDFFDRYAALVALKNMAIIEMRQCLTKLCTDNCSTLSTVDTWLQAEPGKSLYGGAIEIWKDGLFKEIDEEIRNSVTREEATFGGDVDRLEEFNNKAQKLGITQPLSEEIKRYQGIYKLSMSENKTLGA